VGFVADSVGNIVTIMYALSVTQYSTVANLWMNLPHGK